MSDDEGETTLEVRGLDQLIKMMGGNAPVARVGVLGTKAARDSKPNSEGSPTNAEIGAFHEFGEGNNPERSFLRVPIAEHLEKKMEKSGAFDNDVLKEAMKAGSLVPYMKKIAVIGEECVAEAFETGGDGKWPPSDMSRKTNAQTLVETQQLRNSITSDVKESTG